MSRETAPVRDLTGCRVAVAAEPRAMSAASSVDEAAAVDGVFSTLGATVLRVPLHRGEHPIPLAVRRVAYRTASGQVDTVVFLGGVGARSWVSTIERLGMRDAVTERVVSSRLYLAAMGTEAAAPLRGAGLRTTIAAYPTPDDLAGCVVDYFDGGAPAVATDIGRVEVRSGGVLVDERFVPLSRGAAGVIEALFLANGRVLTRDEIGRVLPGRERSARAVEVAVARLRESLDGLDLVQTVVKRGYRLAVSEE